MPVQQEHILNLLRLFAARKASPSQVSELMDILRDPSAESEYLPLYIQVSQESQPVERLPEFEEIETVWQEILSKQPELRKAMPGKTHRMYHFPRWWVAASVILVIAASVFLLVSSDRTARRSEKSTAQAAEILPGKDGAILTLADGSQVLLDTIQNGMVALQGGAMAKVVNGQLIYEANGKEVVYNTVSVPKGRQFHLTLPDGTEVWLNSASAIRYPTVFAGNERRVHISGEVYFEVAKNEKMPFRLSIDDKATIEVLGTHFNVNAYENEGNISTTLIEGAIAFSAAQQRQGVVLKAGQQAALAKNNIKVTDDADIEKVMAWKNGVFDFNNIDFDAAMRQLERWYDIVVVYEKGVPKDVELSGKMTKGVTLNELLFGLEKIGVNCRLEGKKLIIF